MQRSIAGALVAFVCGWSPVAQALPLSADLGLPHLTWSTLLAQAGPSPAPPSETGPSNDGFDHIKLRDGRELRGKILTQVQGGFLFNDSTSKATFVVPFDAIADLQQVHPPPLVSPATPVEYGGASQRRFFLEAELRDLQGRLDGLSDWPGVETCLGGVLGLVIGGVILGFVGTDTLDLVFAGISGGLGAISLGSGIWQLVTVENRKSSLQLQITDVQQELGRLPRAALLPSGPRVSFAF